MKFPELLRLDKEMLKKMTTKERLKHIWEYYKWHLGAICLVIIYIVSIIGSNIDNNSIILNAAFLNTTAYSSDSLLFERDFMNNCQLDPREQTVVFNTSLRYTSSPSAEDATSFYETLQLILARAHTGDLDAIVTTDDPINILIYNEFFMDLSQALSQEQMQAYEPYFLYIDKAFLRYITSIDMSTVDPDMVIAYPDPTKPELMEEPVPILIDISHSTEIARLYPEYKGQLAFGFIITSPHLEASNMLLDYLMK